MGCEAPFSAAPALAWAPAVLMTGNENDVLILMITGLTVMIFFGGVLSVWDCHQRRATPANALAYYCSRLLRPGQVLQVSEGLLYCCFWFLLETVFHEAMQRSLSR